MEEASCQSHLFISDRNITGLLMEKQGARSTITKNFFQHGKLK